MVFSNITSRRLGRRGHTSHHYNHFRLKTNQSYPTNATGTPTGAVYSPELDTTSSQTKGGAPSQQTQPFTYGNGFNTISTIPITEGAGNVAAQTKFSTQQFPQSPPTTYRTRATGYMPRNARSPRGSYTEQPRYASPAVSPRARPAAGNPTYYSPNYTPSPYSVDGNNPRSRIPYEIAQGAPIQHSFVRSDYANNFPSSRNRRIDIPTTSGVPIYDLVIDPTLNDNGTIQIPHFEMDCSQVPNENMKQQARIFCIKYRNHQQCLFDILCRKFRCVQSSAASLQPPLKKKKLDHPDRQMNPKHTNVGTVLAKAAVKADSAAQAFAQAQARADSLAQARAESLAQSAMETVERASAIANPESELTAKPSAEKKSSASLDTAPLLASIHQPDLPISTATLPPPMVSLPLSQAQGHSHQPRQDQAPQAQAKQVQTTQSSQPVPQSAQNQAPQAHVLARTQMPVKEAFHIKLNDGRVKVDLMAYLAEFYSEITKFWTAMKDTQRIFAIQHLVDQFVALERKLKFAMFVVILPKLLQELPYTLTSTMLEFCTQYREWFFRAVHFALPIEMQRQVYSVTDEFCAVLRSSVESNVMGQKLRKIFAKDTAKDMAADWKSSVDLSYIRDIVPKSSSEEWILIQECVADVAQYLSLYSVEQWAQWMAQVVLKLMDSKEPSEGKEYVCKLVKYLSLIETVLALSDCGSRKSLQLFLSWLKALADLFVDYPEKKLKTIATDPQFLSVPQLYELNTSASVDFTSRKRSRSDMENKTNRPS